MTYFRVRLPGEELGLATLTNSHAMTEHYAKSKKGAGKRYSGRHETASPCDFDHDISTTEVPQDPDHYEKDHNGHVERKQRRRNISDKEIRAAIENGNISLAKGDNRYKIDYDGVRVIIQIDPMWDIPGITSTIITVINN